MPKHVLPVRNRLIDFSMSRRFALNFLFIQRRKKLVIKSTQTVATNEMLMLMLE